VGCLVPASVTTSGLPCVQYLFLWWFPHRGL
jgi:hypothetical protein